MTTSRWLYWLYWPCFVHWVGCLWGSCGTLFYGRSWWCTCHGELCRLQETCHEKVHICLLAANQTKFCDGQKFGEIEQHFMSEIVWHLTCTCLNGSFSLIVCVQRKQKHTAHHRPGEQTTPRQPSCMSTNLPPTSDRRSQQQVKNRTLKESWWQPHSLSLSPSTHWNKPFHGQGFSPAGALPALYPER